MGTSNGTTSFGGANSYGTVFKVTPSGTLTTLYNFCSESGCADGQEPIVGLVQAADGSFYGTTFNAGANGFGGTVFKITASGTLTTLHSFCSQSGCADGQQSYAALVQASDGNLYGTTAGGGSNAFGTIFKITPSGALTTLYSFCAQSGCADGLIPAAALVQFDGSFYGTTNGGGLNNAGTVFKITASGVLTTLHWFCAQSGCAAGQSPAAALIGATDGNLYGTTQDGVTNNGGTIFKITPGGALTTLYTFCSQSGCDDGKNPEGALVQDTNGKFYGTTDSGGTSGACTYGCGTVFSLSVGLGPFVEMQPPLGKVRQGVRILGTNLTGATFNGTPAVFHVMSPSFITATVPAGATSGKVQVVMPGLTLSSNVPFRVRP